MLQIYNTLTRKKEIFKPLKGKNVGLYACGPTPYHFAHLGNFRAYVFVDVLRRYLQYKGYKVIHITNLTDVDDKTIKNSQKEGVPLKKFTDKYIKEFFTDVKMLNILRAKEYPRATDYIDDMVKLIKVLLKKGIAYKGEDGSVYYNISKFKEYGKLSGVNLSGLLAGASERVSADEYKKEKPADFALWKAWSKEDGPVFWDTKLGRGRPGWHIECSAMAMKYLGKTFDIHAGGIDLMFPHHENEIAQSEGATGKRFVKYWLHNEHLLVDGRKMSKSLGNFYTLRDILAKGYSPMAIRYILLASQYREQLNFTLQALDGAESTVRRFIDFMDRVSEVKKTGKVFVKTLISKTEKEFTGMINDDLNMPEALAVIHSFVHDVNKLIDENKLTKSDAAAVKKLMLKFDSVLGLNLGKKKEAVPATVKELIKEREEARTRKDFAAADSIRNRIRQLGWIVEDAPKGARIKKA